MLLEKQSIKKIIIGSIFVFLITFLVYKPSLRNRFVWDDFDYVSENTLIYSLSISTLSEMFTSFHASNWHPLTWLSLALDHAFWGVDPFGYHLTNILLHGLNTSLVFLLSISLFIKTEETYDKTSLSIVDSSIPSPQMTMAAVTALLFGLHPLHVESVAWVSERKDLLCAFFVLLSIIFYLSYTSTAVAKYRRLLFTLCLLFFIAALMSKPMAITLPVILLLLDVYPLKRINFYSTKISKISTVLFEKTPFFALSISSGIITLFAQHSGEAIRSLERISFDARLLNAIRSLIFYLEKMVIPMQLVPFYPFPNQSNWFEFRYLVSGILTLTITYFCIWMLKKGNYLFFTVWSYYVITLLPVLGIIQVGDQAAADRYTYLPSLSIFLLMGIGILCLLERSFYIRRSNILKGLIVLSTFTVLFLFGQLTTKQLKIWHNSEILWSYVISVFPENAPNAYINLGSAYLEKDMLDEAIAANKKALALNPTLEKARTNLGLAYSRKGMLDEAVSEYQKALIREPNNAKIHSNLGNTYMRKGMLDEAIAEFRQALSINPNLAGAHINLGSVYTKNGMLDEAIIEYKKALTINPNLVEAHTNLSVVYYTKKNYKLAILHCDKIVQLKGIANPKLLKLLEPYR